MENAPDFFVCFYKDKKGRPTGHATGPTDKFSSDLHKQIEHEHIESNLGSLFDIFCQSMMGYIDMLPFIAAMSNAVTWGIQTGELREFCENNCESRSSRESNDIFRLSSSKYYMFSLIDQRADTGRLVGKQVPKMLIIGVVSSMDHHIAQLVRTVIRKYPSIISESDKQISLKDLFKAKDIDEFKENILDKEVENVTRNSFDDQIEWLEKRLSIQRPIKSDYPRWSSLVEIVERRNLFAHANGVVNNIYLKNVSEASGGSTPKVSKGTELFASPKYFKSTLETVFEFGIKLSQVVWRKLEPQDSIQADDALGDIGFDLIERGEYSLAISILEFSIYDVKGRKEEGRRRIDIVNLANAYKLSGNLKKSIEIIDSEDWGIVSDEYAICVYAIKEEMEQVLKYMERLGRSGEWDGAKLEDWPVFFGMREKKEFVETFRKVFNREYVPQPKNKHRVFDNFFANAALKDRATRTRIQPTIIDDVEVVRSDSPVAIAKRVPRKRRTK